MFSYRAYDKNGVLLTGDIEATSRDMAREKLIQQGLEPIEIKAQQKKLFEQGLFQSNRLTLSDLEFITAELSLLLKSGIKIDRAVAVLAKTRVRPAVKQVLSDLSQVIKRGESLADAFGKQPGFDKLYVNLVKMGEASGELDKVFEGLAQDLKFRKELRSKIIQSLVYPGVIFFVCVVAVLFVFNFIVPQMASLFEETANLPLYTELLINASAWMRSYQIHLFIGLVIVAASIRMLLNKGVLNEWFDTVLLRLPLIRGGVLQVERIRFSTSISLMLGAGVKIDEAIELAAGTVKNTKLSQQLKLARAKVKRGEALSASLSGSPIFDDFYLSLLEIGEESGDLSPVFYEISSRSRESFNSWVTRLTSLLEPIMILVMGAIVGGVVVVMLLSIISVNDGF